MSAETGQTKLDAGVRPQHPEHLEDIDSDDDTGGWRCRECRAKVTIDPHTSVEYGHIRRHERGGRCPHRPASVDTGTGGRR